MSKEYRSNDKINQMINEGELSTNYGFKNYIINGAFDVWQRGTSFTNVVGGSQFTADRFNAGTSGTTSTITHTSTMPSLLAGTSLRLVDAGNTYSNIRQRIEAISAKYLANKKATLSYYIKSDKSVNCVSLVRHATAVDNYTGVTNIISVFTALTAGVWKKIELVMDVPAGASNGIEVLLYGNYGSGASNGFNITQVQLEEGSVATPFEQRPYGLELSLCQRYYEQSPALSGISGVKELLAISTSALGGFHFLQTKRVAPSISIYSRSGAVGKVSDMSTGVDSASVGINTIGATAFHYVSGSGFVVGHLYEANYTASAEL